MATKMLPSGKSRQIPTRISPPFREKNSTPNAHARRTRRAFREKTEKIHQGILLR